MISAKIIEDSMTRDRVSRITTVELNYPRFIHGEVMTHRVFSRNAMSSRAIPVEKMIEQVRNNPAGPIHWGQNQKGMQASQEVADTMEARQQWMMAARQAADRAEAMDRIGVHKQVANRVLEPFQWMRTIVTATEWDNFFELRCHPDAQPEFQALANRIKEGMDASSPAVREAGYSHHPDNWHLPYVSEIERKTIILEVLPKLSAARCARVSYLTHDKLQPTVEADLALFDRLVGSVPLHASPIEHQAVAIQSDVVSRNFVGWRQYREIYEAKKAG